MKINLATSLAKRLVEFLEDQMDRGRMDIDGYMSVEDLLCDDDGYSDWLNKNWWIIKEYNMVVVRDFMTWSYLMDSDAASPVELEYTFDLDEI